MAVDNNDRNLNAAVLGDAYQNSQVTEGSNNDNSTDNSDTLEVGFEDSLNDNSSDDDTTNVGIEDSFQDNSDDSLNVDLEDSFNDESVANSGNDNSTNTDNSTDDDIAVGFEDSLNDNSRPTTRTIWPSGSRIHSRTTPTIPPTIRPMTISRSASKTA